MKFTSVKELKEKIDAELEAEKCFETHLMNKYPSLFNKDADGKLLPPDCGIWCPPGWRNLVERLCGSIVFRVKNNHTYTPRKFFALPVRLWIWNRLVYPIRVRVDPKTKAFKNKRFITGAESNKIDAEHPWRTYIVRNIFSRVETFLVPRNKYKPGPIPEVKIGQIKEKFGTLRFYYDGGDSVVQGMVSFAEALSGNICEMTGEAGSLCKKGKGMTWYKTLSERKANEIGYTKVE
jgi:hypothetical protein